MPALSLKDRFRLLGKAALGVMSESAQHDIFGMLSGIQPGGQGQPPPKGTQQFLEAYSQMPWLRAVAGRVASSVAQTEWQLYVEKKKGAPKATRNALIQRAGPANRRKMIKSSKDRGDATQIESHVMLDTLNNANSFQTGDAMWKVTMLHVDLVGEAFWVKERDGLGTVVGLWPLPPHWVLNTPTPVNPTFRVGFRSWRGLIPDTEVIWFSDPNPVNPYGRGSGTAQALGDELETDEYAAKHTKAFFYNRARPDLLVYPKNGQTMRTADAQRMEEDWLNHNQGFWRAFKPYFLNREVGVTQLEQNFRSLQLVQIREFERNSIIQMFGMPPELLGVVENSNRATIDAADYLFSRYVVQPRLEFLRAVLQERLVPEYDERLIIDYVSPIQDDKELELKALTVAPWSVNLNEWRQRVNAEPLPDEQGKVFVFPNTVKPMSLDKAVEQAENPPEPQIVLPPGAGPGGEPKPPKPAKPKPPAEDGGKAWRALLRADAAICDAAKDFAARDGLFKLAAQDEGGVELPAATAEAASRERAFARSIFRTLSDQREQVEWQALERACGSGDADGVIAALSLGQADELLRAACQPTMQSMFVRGAHLGASALSGVKAARKDDEGGLQVDFAAVNELSVEYARRFAARLMAAPAIVQAQVRILVTQSIAAGISPRDLARMIVSVVGLTERQSTAVQSFRARLAAEGQSGEVLERRVERYSEALLRERALTIARTELISALNAGQVALWRQQSQAGAIDDTLRRIWLVTDDELLEAECEAIGADSEEHPKRLDEPFEGGYDAPPAHPRCRCSLGLVRAGDNGGSR